MPAPLSPYEETKARLDPYGSRDEVFARLARSTVAEITPADDIVMRWHGLYRQLPLEDEAFMLRVKLPEGALSTDQASILANLADLVGDGRLTLTTRQGIELHGVKLSNLPTAYATLDAAGILTAGACGDQVRNVVGCPAAGIDPGELLDTTTLARRLTAAFLGNPLFANLPRKFKIALSACPCGCVPYDVNDVGLVAVDRGDGNPGYAVLVGGGLSVQPVFASHLGIWISEEESLSVITGLIEIFREHGNRENRGRARVKHLVAANGIDWFRDELEQRLGRALTPYAHPVPAPARRDHLGVHAQREDGRVYLGIPMPVGFLPSDQFRRLSTLAGEFGQGQLRLTHLQNLILPGIERARLPQMLDQLKADGLPMPSEDRNHRVVVCVGKTYCTRAITRTKEPLRELVDAIDDPLLGTEISLRVSGCPNGCGGHAMADIGLRGASVKTGAGSEERFDLYAGGGETSGTPAFAQRILNRQRGEELPGAISTLLRRFHDEASAGETFSDYARRVLWQSAGESD